MHPKSLGLVRHEDLSTKPVIGFILNPLSVCEITDTCVFPVCHYGCENWILMAPLFKIVEDKIGQTVLHLPQQPVRPPHSEMGHHASNVPPSVITCALIVMSTSHLQARMHLKTISSELDDVLKQPVAADSLQCVLYSARP